MHLLKSFSAKASILKNVQILLVDNDPDTREMYDFLLKDCGATLTAVGTVKEALEILMGLLPNILVCEIRFLGESVNPLLRQLRLMEIAYGRHIPILITSSSITKSLAKILGVEVEQCLLKPIDLDHLVLKIWNLTLGHKNPLSTYSREPRMKPESEPDFFLEPLASA